MPNKRRLFVHIYVTPICNLRCRHCYYDAKPVGSKIEHSLSVLDIANIIVDLCDKYDAFFDVEGGEFFLRTDIEKLFDVLPSDYWNRITITTNGITKITIDSEVILKLDEFRISVEGHTDELQREIRGINLAPVIKTCRELKQAGIPLVLRITLHKKNFLMVKQMLEWFTEQGFDRFSLYEFQPTGRGFGHELEYALNENELTQVLQGLCMNPVNKDIKLLKLSLSERRNHLVSSLRNELNKSGYEIIDLSNAASLVVNYDGSLGVCPWNVGSEVLGYYDSSRFAFDVQKFIDTGQLDHFCRYCSSMRVRTISIAK
jgi:MoaA/NifB/PqqE/SkfB family radical SAM enzyme